MRWREQLREFRDFPGTTILTVIWVGVYVASLVYQGSFTVEFNSNILMGLGGIDTKIGHAFGDARAIDFYEHQWWRAVTSSVFHYSFLHILLNLFGLIQLGRLVESWYGTGPFLLVSVVIGGVGNLLAGYVRPMMGGDPAVHCAGGSTLVMGLVGLCAMVGWRSKTRIGRSMQRQMVGVLVLTAILGFLIPVIDNYGHTFGSLVGGFIGLFHRRLEQIWSRGTQFALGAIALGVFGVCGVLQYRSTVKEIETYKLEIGNSTAAFGAIERVQFYLAKEMIERGQLNRHFNRGEFIALPKGQQNEHPGLHTPWKIAIAEAQPDFEKACVTLAYSPDDPVTNRALELFRILERTPVNPAIYTAFLEPTNALKTRAQTMYELALARGMGR